MMEEPRHLTITLAAPARPHRPLLVGESNPFGSDPAFALYHLPRTSSGNRLRSILRLTDAEYLAQLDRANLLTGRSWGAVRARDAAAALLRERASTDPALLAQPLVLLGRKVAEAFGLGYLAPLQRVFWTGFAILAVKARVRPAGAGAGTAAIWADTPPRRIVLLPHPSGRGREWNVFRAKRRARKLVAALVRDERLDAEQGPQLLDISGIDQYGNPVEDQRCQSIRTRHPSEVGHVVPGTYRSITKIVFHQ
jgi:hypothetical protein